MRVCMCVHVCTCVCVGVHGCVRVGACTYACVYTCDVISPQYSTCLQSKGSYG